MISFIHTGDLHFGVENYGRVDPQTGIHSRLLDFNKAFAFVVSTAIEKDVDFFLLCGDAYKTAHPTPTQQRLLLDNLIKLYNANIPVVLIVGNHDLPGSFGKSNALDLFSRLPVSGFHLISRPQILPLQTKHGIIQIIGIPWPSRNTVSLNKNNISSIQTTQLISDTITDLIQQLVNQKQPDIPSILAGHLTVSTGIFSGSEKSATTSQDPIFLPSQLALPGIEYVALGHLHRYQQVNPNQHPAIIYSGSIERIDFGEADDTKGFCLVQLDKQNTRATFIPTPVRPCIEINIKLTLDKDPTEQLIQEIQRHDIHDAILKIRYTVPADMTTPIQMRTVYTACSAAHHIAGIIPILEKKPKTSRTALAPTLSPSEALTQFLTLQNISAQRIARITKKLEKIITITEEKLDTSLITGTRSKTDPTEITQP